MAAAGGAAGPAPAQDFPVGWRNLTQFSLELSHQVRARPRLVGRSPRLPLFSHLPPPLSSLLPPPPPAAAAAAAAPAAAAVSDVPRWGVWRPAASAPRQVWGWCSHGGGGD